MTKYINMRKYINNKYTFNAIIGGRGTGKTYGSLKTAYEDNIIMLYMRRTQTEIDLLAGSGESSSLNPFKKYASDNGKIIDFDRINKYVYGIYDKTEEQTKLIGYAVGMSVISRIRGADFSDVSLIVYDEFIPEGHVSKMRDEANGFFNAYETINRNREFEGQQACKCLLLSNSNDIYSPIFVELGVISQIEHMARKMKTNSVERAFEARNFFVALYNNPDFAEKKRETALYQLTQGTRFAEMAIDNQFVYNDFSLVKYLDVKGMLPICAVDEMYLYRTKDNSVYYVSYAKADVVTENRFSITKQDKTRFWNTYGTQAYRMYVYSKMFFETYDLKHRFLDFALAGGYKE